MSNAVRLVNKLIAPLQRRVAMMVARGVLDLIDDGKKMQTVQVKLFADEVAPAVERFQEYGFTSSPFPGAEAVVVFPGGVRSHGIIVAVDDRRYRLTGLAGGEVALYDDQGQVVHLKRDGLALKSPLKVTAEAPEITLTGGSNADQVAQLTDAGVVLKSSVRVDVTAPALTMVDLAGNQLLDIDGGGIALTSPVPVDITAPIARIHADEAKVFADDLQLGGAGGAAVARVGDTVSGGVITSGSSKVTAA